MYPVLYFSTAFSHFGKMIVSHVTCLRFSSSELKFYIVNNIHCTCKIHQYSFLQTNNKRKHTGKKNDITAEVILKLPEIVYRRYLVNTK